MIELNHFYCPDGGWIYDQAIAWNKDPATGKYYSVGFALVSGYQAGSYSRMNGWVTVTVQTGTTLVVVTSRMARETWTQEDPERLDRRQQIDNGHKPFSVFLLHQESHDVPYISADPSIGP